MKQKKKIKYALVLSGGGFNGAFQIGALNYLNENWKKLTGLNTPMKFDVIAGVSVGAINGAMLAAGKLEELNELWMKQVATNGASEIYTSDFIDIQSKGDQLKMKLNLAEIKRKLLPNYQFEIGFWEKLGLIFSKKKRSKFIKKQLNLLTAEFKSNFSKFNALADNSPLLKKLKFYLKQDAVETDFICGFVSLQNGSYQSVLHSKFKTNEDFIKGVLASAAIPMVFQPVEEIEFSESDSIQKSLSNVDGGISNVSPLGDVIHYIKKDKADYRIIIINCKSGVPKEKDAQNMNIAQVAARSLYDVAITEIFNNDIHHFLKINELVNQVKVNPTCKPLKDKEGNTIREFEHLIIQPNDEIDLGNGLVANEKLIQLRFDHGLNQTSKVAKLGFQGGTG